MIGRQSQGPFVTAVKFAIRVRVQQPLMNFVIYLASVLKIYVIYLRSVLDPANLPHGDIY